MIKYINLTAQVRSEKDFDLLTKLLSALGLQNTEVEDYPHLRLQPFIPSGSTLEVVYRKKPHQHADLELVILDPDSAAEIIKKIGLPITEDHSGPDPSHPVREFRVDLPGGTSLLFTGLRTTATEPDNIGVEGKLSASGKKFAIIVSRFNSFIAERLLAGAIDGLTRCGIASSKDIRIVRVPGSFEIPSAARTLAETKKYDAVICLGCLLRGDTAHYDVIVNEVTRGIGQSAQETGVSHAFGVLTCDTLEQAIDRAGLKMGNKGFEAALAAVEMANLKKAISRQPSAVRKGKKGARSPVSGLRKTRQKRKR
jgi:6,7-dimethyl-8-ribityllumazine synthase